MTSLMTLNQHKQTENYVRIASLKREIIGKPINRILGLRLFISSLPGSALRTSALKALPGKLDIKRHSPSILFLLCFQMFERVNNLEMS